MCAERTAAGGRHAKKVATAALDLEIGARLRNARILLGMSQEALGEKVGVTFQQIQKYEKGTNRVSASMMLRLADELGVPPAIFTEGLHVGGEPLPVITDRHALRAAELVAALSAPQRAKVVAMLETFVSPAGEMAA